MNCTREFCLFIAYGFVQLEFSLLALRDDPLPALQVQLDASQSSGNSQAAAEILSVISNEQSKRKRWAVSGRLSADTFRKFDTWV